MKTLGRECGGRANVKTISIVRRQAEIQGRDSDGGKWIRVMP